MTVHLSKHTQTTSQMKPQINPQNKTQSKTENRPQLGSKDFQALSSGIGIGKLRAAKPLPATVTRPDHALKSIQGATKGETYPPTKHTPLPPPEYSSSQNLTTGITKKAVAWLRSATKRTNSQQPTQHTPHTQHTQQDKDMLVNLSANWRNAQNEHAWQSPPGSKNYAAKNSNAWKASTDAQPVTAPQSKKSKRSKKSKPPQGHANKEHNSTLITILHLFTDFLGCLILFLGILLATITLRPQGTMNMEIFLSPYSWLYVVGISLGLFVVNHLLHQLLGLPKISEMIWRKKQQES